MDQPWVYIVLLGLCCIVASSLFSRKTGDRPRSENAVREIEETMEHFAEELAEQNEQLLESVSKMKREQDEQVTRLGLRIEQLERQNGDLDRELKRVWLAAAAGLEAQSAASALERKSSGIDSAEIEAAAEPVVSPNHLPMRVRDRYPAVFELVEQGKNAESIAKKLGLPKGEVALIIQLAKQEENSGASE